jgi:hypothetical protein
VTADFAAINEIELGGIHGRMPPIVLVGDDERPLVGSQRRLSRLHVNLIQTNNRSVLPARGLATRPRCGRCDWRAIGKRARALV